MFLCAPIIRFRRFLQLIVQPKMSNYLSIGLKAMLCNFFCNINIIQMLVLSFHMKEWGGWLVYKHSRIVFPFSSALSSIK